LRRSNYNLLCHATLKAQTFFGGSYLDVPALRLRAPACGPAAVHRKAAQTSGGIVMVVIRLSHFRKKP